MTLLCNTIRESCLGSFLRIIVNLSFVWCRHALADVLFALLAKSALQRVGLLWCNFLATVLVGIVNNMSFDETEVGRVSSLGNRFVSCVHVRTALLPSEMQGRVGVWEFSVVPCGLRRFSHFPRVQVSVTKWNQVKTHEIKGKQVKPNEINRSQVNPSQTKQNHMEPSETKEPSESNPSATRWNQAKQTQITWHQVKSSETKWNQVKPSDTNRKHVCKWVKLWLSASKWYKVKLSESRESKWKQVSQIESKGSQAGPNRGSSLPLNPPIQILLALSGHVLMAELSYDNTESRKRSRHTCIEHMCEHLRIPRNKCLLIQQACLSMGHLVW